MAWGYEVHGQLYRCGDRAALYTVVDRLLGFATQNPEAGWFRALAAGPAIQTPLDVKIEWVMRASAPVTSAAATPTSSIIGPPTQKSTPQLLTVITLMQEVRRSSFATPTSDASPAPCSPEQHENLSESPALAEAMGNAGRGSKGVNPGADNQPDAETGHMEIGDCNAAVDTPGATTSAVEGQVDPATSEAECQDTSSPRSACTWLDNLVAPRPNSNLSDVEPSGTIKMTSTGDGKLKHPGSGEKAGAINTGRLFGEQDDAGAVVEAKQGLSISLEEPDVVNLPTRPELLGLFIAWDDEGEESLPEIQSDNDSTSEDKGGESEPAVRTRQDPKPVEDRTFRAPGQRAKTAPLQIPAWSKSIPMPTRDQLDFALGMNIGLETMDKLKNGEQVEITVRQDKSHASCRQEQFYAGIARQNPVLWMVAAWIHGAFNLHAPPTNDQKKLDDISKVDMTTLVAIVSPNAGEPMELPWGNVQWILDNGTLDRFLLAGGNGEGFCLERKGNKWSKAETLCDFLEET
ncbi:hypothetical protein FN846DRAFT_907884 [Sphaerosporella brunnea]|uniref:Uncharacterized protein n=1 Tax=Sphaerosporella brunnea TaxID=1250544 RepID=A0A5J5EU71_9PEZI|nr:hypothetical protein FN846DRAFT_907884 [Sphaerosporella brunnea]